MKTTRVALPTGLDDGGVLGSLKQLARSPSIKRTAMRSVFFASAAAVLFGCTLADVKVNVVSERTALENQVLGTYNSLDREMLLVASVRSVDPSGRIKEPPRMSQERKDALAAMQTLAFHADDLQAFKRLGWVGENNEGLLSVFPVEEDDAPEDLAAFANRYTEAEFNAVVGDINEAREVMMQRVIELNEHFTTVDLPQVHRIFGKINAENALSGERIQTEDGTWTTKE